MKSIIPIARPATVSVSQVEGEPVPTKAKPASSGISPQSMRSGGTRKDCIIDSVGGLAVASGERKTE